MYVFVYLEKSDDESTSLSDLEKVISRKMARLTLHFRSRTQEAKYKQNFLIKTHFMSVC